MIESQAQVQRHPVIVATQWGTLIPTIAPQCLNHGQPLKFAQSPNCTTKATGISQTVAKGCGCVADAVPWTSEAVISKRTNALSTKEPQEYEFPEIWAETEASLCRIQGQQQNKGRRSGQFWCRSVITGIGSSLQVRLDFQVTDRAFN
ncbi:predicted protein [Histoplasma capsulatum G186AR]|uniref:Uncharacterized protein n=1 Tax=Ajellomyces capsulatus (strain G186AR / H82 / ATCC MYA-2454 / RMSCC 2432) TaxID=447093 RepID=C0NWQ7_AJECG|nr:uncharacterized protein HCBG_07587 [Histoplasma capsulatum G186AR]EEH04362.1 predicted protein [Histoplasma capsulatum G186AR]